jgi:hypothetical protein
LNWTDSTDGTGMGLWHYLIYRDSTNIANTSSSQFLDLPLNHSTSYAYSIVPHDRANNSGYAYNFTAATSVPGGGPPGDGPTSPSPPIPLDEKGEEQPTAPVLGGTVMNINILDWGPFYRAINDFMRAGSVALGIPHVIFFVLGMTLGGIAIATKLLKTGLFVVVIGVLFLAVYSFFIKDWLWGILF